MSFISDMGSLEKFAFDTKHSTIYSSENDVCFIGMDIGEGRRVKINRIRYFPYNRWTIAASYIKGATIEGSEDGITYY